MKLGVSPRNLVDIRFQDAEEGEIRDFPLKVQGFFDEFPNTPKPPPVTLYARRSLKMIFESIQPGIPDHMYDLKKRADSDSSPSKVDLGVGIYRNEQGAYQELQCVKEVSQS